MTESFSAIGLLALAITLTALIVIAIEALRWRLRPESRRLRTIKKIRRRQ
jgi:hypothetical protein